MILAYLLVLAIEAESRKYTTHTHIPAEDAFFLPSMENEKYRGWGGGIQGQYRRKSLPIRDY